MARMRWSQWGVLAGALGLLASGRALSQAPAVAVLAGGTPLSGIVRSGDLAYPGVTVVVRAVTGGGETTTRLLKTEIDGTFVLPSAPRGLYTLLALVPGLPMLAARILHTAAPESVSFVRLDFQDASEILPGSGRGAADPWTARAATKGDVLRDVGAILAALEDPAPEPTPVDRVASAEAPRGRVPVRASLSSTAGFGSTTSSTLSQTALDVSGSLGGNLRWNVDGRYSRLSGTEGGAAGDASRLTLDLASGDQQSLRLATRRQVRILDESESARFAAHALDWTAVTGQQSQASVSARFVTQTNAFMNGAAADLFARSSDVVDVYAGYRTQFNENTSVRFLAGYRHATSPDGSGITDLITQETRVGAVGGARVLPALSVEAGATGDFSARNRGITPEVTLTLHPSERWRVLVGASRRFERRLEDGLPDGQVSADEADLSRISRMFLRGGIRYDGPDGAGFLIEGSRREITGVQRLLLDPDFFERLDSLYFFPGDVATEISAALSARISRSLAARVGARVGRVTGERDAVIRSDDATWSRAEAALLVNPTGTSVGVGYRLVQQILVRGDLPLHNDLSTVDFSLSQALPVPVLRSLATDWRALVSVEFGRRRDGQEQEKLDHRLAGGLAVSF